MTHKKGGDWMWLIAFLVITSDVNALETMLSFQQRPREAANILPFWLLSADLHSSEEKIGFWLPLEMCRI